MWRKSSKEWNSWVYLPNLFTVCLCVYVSQGLSDHFNVKKTSSMTLISDLVQEYFPERCERISSKKLERMGYF